MPSIRPNLAARVRITLFARGLGALERLGSKFGRGPSVAEHIRTGQWGEQYAFHRLRRKGYIVTAQAWRSPHVRGDLDLIAWDSDTLCFIEVKTRSSRAIAPAQAAVDRDKRRTLRRLARHYIKRMDYEPEKVRFDIVSVYVEPGTAQSGAPESAASMEHFEAVFGWLEEQD